MKYNTPKNTAAFTPEDAALAWLSYIGDPTGMFEEKIIVNLEERGKEKVIEDVAEKKKSEEEVIEYLREHYEELKNRLKEIRGI